MRNDGLTKTVGNLTAGRGALEVMIRLVAWFFGLASLLFGLLVLVNLLPNEPILAHVRESAPPDYEYMDLGTPTWELDHWTECAGAGIGLSATSNPIVRTLESSNFGNCEEIARSGSAQKADQSYWRYWHGYQLLSRPVLSVVSLARLRDVTAMLFMGAFAFFALASGARWGGAPLAAFCCAAMLVPFVSQLGLFTHALVWVLAFALTAWLLRPGQGEIFQTDRLRTLFLLQGMLTVFFDFLTTPLVTFTLPAAVLLLKWRDEKRDLGAQLRTLVPCGMVWCAGFAGLWMLKWALALWLVPGATLADLTEPIKVRAGAQDSYGDTLARTDGLRLMAWQAQNALIFSAALAALAFVKGRRALKTVVWPQYAPLALIALAPAVWGLVFLNHVETHYTFTTPMLIPSLFIANMLSLRVLKGTPNGLPQSPR